MHQIEAEILQWKFFHPELCDKRPFFPCPFPCVFAARFGSNKLLNAWLGFCWIRRILIAHPTTQSPFVQLICVILNFLNAY